MKKFLCILLLTATLLNVLCLGAAATEGASRYSDNLLLHYDFEGATKEEALKDKAQGGSASNLTPMANNTDAAQETDFTFDLTNGTVTKNSAGTAFLQTKTASGDFDCISEGKATMFLRYKMDPTLTAGANNGDRAWLADGKASSAHRFLTLTYYDGKLENILTSGNSDGHGTNGVINHTYAQDGAYSNYMVTYEKAEGGKILMTAYICMGDDFSENAWTLIGTKTTTGDDVMKPSDYADMTFRLFGSFFCDPTQKAGVTMDDMRIYNTVLTTAQMTDELKAAEIAGNLDLGDVHIVGYQNSALKDGKYDLRFVAVMDDLSAERVGFEMQASYHDGTKDVILQTETDTKFAYTSILADGEILSAQSLGGAYIVAVEIHGIPASISKIDFEIIPYCLVQGERVYEERKSIPMTVTYSRWVEYEFETWTRQKSEEDWKDQALIEALIERMGDSFVFEIGHSSALYQKKIRKLDTTDYSRAAKLAGNGDILIPAQFLRNYYSETVTADADGYVNLTALCNADANLTLFYNASTKLVIVTPANVASFADPTQSSGGYTNAQYTARMTGFFHSELMPEPQNNTEQSRVVIEYIPYPDTVLDYTTTYYHTTYSPGIAMVKDGDETILYASYEISEVCNIESERSTTTVIKKSTDYGKTWEKVGEVKDVRWASIFNRGKEIYIIGNSLTTGAAVIAKLDEGKTSRFVQIATGTGGTAPTAVLEHGGRIYKAYTNHVLSAPSDADLLDPTVWIKSQSVQDVLTSQKIGEITGRPNATAMPIEPNVVAGEDGKLYVFYRIDRATQMQIVLELSKDGKTFSLVEDINSIIKDFPTSKSKITIRYDESTGKYFTISSLYMGGRMQNQRIVLALAVSDDLFHWEVVDYLLVSREMANPEWEMYAHGYQYADFVIDGDNILMVVREAVGYTNCYHDGNYTAFYVIENYKDMLSD